MHSNWLICHLDLCFSLKQCFYQTIQHFLDG
jgi:hypothetical protein